MTIAIIGGGAAGFFAAINCAELFPGHTVVIFEKTGKLLSKVRVSGGGRCNVTHACFDTGRLVENYPRGKKELRNAFARFSTKDTVEWFESRGVKLKTESDGRMFPVTDNSGSIINCLIKESEKKGIDIRLNHPVSRIAADEHGKFQLSFQGSEFFSCDRVIITTGGNPNLAGYDWLGKLGHTIIKPVPSLFTFNLPSSPLKGLEGISCVATIHLEGLKFEATGPLLITHWGLSGPAVLRLSAFAARRLYENNYIVACIINWLPEMKEEEVRENVLIQVKEFPGKRIYSTSLHNIPNRLWHRLCFLSGIEENEKWGDINKSKINRLIHNSHNLKLEIKGKTTFKEEFVTCGGVSLKEVNMQTMESKIVKGLFFAGEILDIDGITGGFNFQAAWTTGYLAGVNAGK